MSEINAKMENYNLANSVRHKLKNQTDSRGANRAFISKNYQDSILPIKNMRGVVMEDLKLEYFKQKLVIWRKELIAHKSDVGKTLLATEEGSDIIDIANDYIVQYEKIPEINHINFLINEINKALERLVNGSYGYCEITGELIEEKRLEAWPIARLSLEEQEAREKKAKQQAR